MRREARLAQEQADLDVLEIVEHLYSEFGPISKEDLREYMRGLSRSSLGRRRYTMGSGGVAAEESLGRSLSRLERQGVIKIDEAEGISLI